MPSRPLLLAAAFLCALFGLLIPDAQAHARMIKSEPLRDAEVTAAPAQVELWFNELLETGFNFVSVFPESELGAKKRTDFVSGKPSVDPKDRTRIVAALKPLPPGEYIVEWRVLSRDGHTAPGRFKFRVKAR